MVQAHAPDRACSFDAPSARIHARTTSAHVQRTTARLTAERTPPSFNSFPVRRPPNLGNYPLDGSTLTCYHLSIQVGDVCHVEG